jgi:hypothetical protein
VPSRERMTNRRSSCLGPQVPFGLGPTARRPRQSLCRNGTSPIAKLRKAHIIWRGGMDGIRRSKGNKPSTRVALSRLGRTPLSRAPGIRRCSKGV